jgi:aspartate ammonia-lyase
VVKAGRTQLQDAVPMALGQEFTAFDVTLAEDMARTPRRCRTRKASAPTAAGTGITAETGYAEAATRHLGARTWLELKPAFDLVEATSVTSAFLLVAGVLRRLAVT